MIALQSLRRSARSRCRRSTLPGPATLPSSRRQSPAGRSACCAGVIDCAVKRGLAVEFEIGHGVLLRPLADRLRASGCRSLRNLRLPSRGDCADAGKAIRPRDDGLRTLKAIGAQAPLPHQQLGAIWLKSWQFQPAAAFFCGNHAWCIDTLAGPAKSGLSVPRFAADVQFL
jgi:hypothetical protein